MYHFRYFGLLFQRKIQFCTYFLGEFFAVRGAKIKTSRRGSVFTFGNLNSFRLAIKCTKSKNRLLQSNDISGSKHISYFCFKSGCLFSNLDESFQMIGVWVLSIKVSTTHHISLFCLCGVPRNANYNLGFAISQFCLF